jgi:hypothetical protein
MLKITLGLAGTTMPSMKTSSPPSRRPEDDYGGANTPTHH